MITRAIYLPDARFNSMMIFELNDGKFTCVTDKAYQYNADVVFSDPDWLILSMDDNKEKIENIR